VNLSAREKRLAVLTLLVLVGAGCVLLALQARDHVASLDRRIVQLEQELLNLTQQNAQRSAVEAAYLEVVATHSSEMTKAEIHDNLRREIFSLAKRTVKGKKGQPDRQVSLVKIPTLREGMLREEGEGYREYQVQFRILGTTLPNVMQFLQRIETSSQILRIDGLDLGRPPESTRVHATLVITRTVLDSPDAVPQRGGAGARVARVGSD
jgi:hypothetical protein